LPVEFILLRAHSQTGKNLFFLWAGAHRSELPNPPEKKEKLKNTTGA
jgi:hypothetical protein